MKNNKAENFQKNWGSKGKRNKNREAGLDQKLRIVLSLIWPEIKNYEAEPIWGILIKKEGVYVATLDIAAALPIATSTPVTGLRHYINNNFVYNDLIFRPLCSK